MSIFLPALCIGATAFIAFLVIILGGHNLRKQHSHAAREITRHLGMVTNFLLKEPRFVRMVRVLFAKFEPYILRMGNYAVQHFGRRGFFFRGPLKVIPLFLG